MRYIIEHPHYGFFMGLSHKQEMLWTMKPCLYAISTLITFEDAHHMMDFFSSKLSAEDLGMIVSHPVPDKQYVGLEDLREAGLLGQHTETLLYHTPVIGYC